MKRSIAFEFEFAHPPERVWLLLTSSEAMAKWLMPNDFRPVLGHRFTLQREPLPELAFDGVTRCEVITLKPARELAFTFCGGVLDTIVSFRLERTESGTRLYFEHSGFDIDDPRQAFAFQAMSGGWAKLGSTFEALLASEGTR